MKKQSNYVDSRTPEQREADSKIESTLTTSHTMTEEHVIENFRSREVLLLYIGIAYKPNRWRVASITRKWEWRSFRFNYTALLTRIASKPQHEAVDNQSETNNQKYTFHYTGEDDKQYSKSIYGPPDFDQGTHFKEWVKEKQIEVAERIASRVRDRADYPLWADRAVGRYER